MSLAPLFFRRSVGAFLVYDVTSMESFKAIDKWYQQILKNTDTKVIVMLLGNKKDKENREVPYNTAAKYAMEHNFGLMEVSAKLGHGVKEAFNRMVAEIYRSMEMEGLTEVYAESPNFDRAEVHQGSIILDSQKHYNMASHTIENSSGVITANNE